MIRAVLPAAFLSGCVTLGGPLLPSTPESEQRALLEQRLQTCLSITRHLPARVICFEESEAWCQAAALPKDCAEDWLRISPDKFSPQGN